MVGGGRRKIFSFHHSCQVARCACRIMCTEQVRVTALTWHVEHSQLILIERGATTTSLCCSMDSLDPSHSLDGDFTAVVALVVVFFPLSDQRILPE